MILNFFNNVSATSSHCGTWFVLVLTLASLLVVGCEKPKPFGGASMTAEQKAEKRKTDKQVANLVYAEDTTLDIAPQIKELTQWFETATATSKLTPSLKSLKVVKGVEPNVKLKEQIEAGLASSASKRVDASGIVSKVELPIAKKAINKPVNPWQPVAALGVTWNDMKLGIVKASFTDDDKLVYVVESTVEADGANQAGQAFGISGHQSLKFVNAGPGRWTLTEWAQKDLTVTASPGHFFTDIVKQALVEPATLSRAQRSVKDEMLVKAADTENGMIYAPKEELTQWIGTDSVTDFPAVSVVDYDSDGLEDLYLTGRWGPTQMLKNMGDGTFKDVTKECGLHFDYQVNCAMFADLDNDGDPDAIIGRASLSSRYLINVDGVFKDATRSHSNLGKVFFISGISFSDVNRDGLLDVYVSTYPPLRNGKNWEYSFLGTKERTLYQEHLTESNPFTNLVGPANILLMNRGDGKLERVPYDEVLSQWRYSFQSVWADIDNDGDDDIYICNDFAPDSLLRNDTPQGSADPVFVDVVDQWVPKDAKGFGMGGSFGDFDSDGDLDLYVSNMYSKAGNRVIGLLDNDVDPILKTSAFGNFLLENKGGSFVQRAGKGKGELPVNKVGWSYGGQWADFDNNGTLDLYVPSGYYTAPKEIATKIDL